jgi:hypothetical protein
MGERSRGRGHFSGWPAYERPVLDGDSLRTVAWGHEVGWVPLYAIGASAAETMLVPSRGAVLCVVCRWAVIGLLLRRLCRGRLRQGWETEHGATRVSFDRTPSSRCAVILGSSGPRGRCRRRRMFACGPPWVVLRIGRRIVR